MVASFQSAAKKVFPSAIFYEIDPESKAGKFGIVGLNVLPGVAVIGSALFAQKKGLLSKVPVPAQVTRLLGRVQGTPAVALRYVGIVAGLALAAYVATLIAHGFVTLVTKAHEWATAQPAAEPAPAPAAGAKSTAIEIAAAPAAAAPAAEPTPAPAADAAAPADKPVEAPAPAAPALDGNRAVADAKRKLATAEAALKNAKDPATVKTETAGVLDAQKAILKALEAAKAQAEQAPVSADKDANVKAATDQVAAQRATVAQAQANFDALNPQAKK